MYYFQYVLIGFFGFTILALIISGFCSYCQFGCGPRREYIVPSTPSAPELEIVSQPDALIDISRQIANDALYYGIDNGDRVFDRCHLVLNELPPAYETLYK